MNKHNPNNENIQFPLTNDLVFSLVMQDTDLCKELIQRIFPERKIAELKFSDTYVESQKSLINGIIEKSVRLDVLFIGDDQWYNLELQTTFDEHLPMSGRYYGCSMDMDQIKKGERYNQLKPSYVIFICTFDFYGLDQAIYSFENYDMRNSLPYGDNSYKIIVNTTCSEESTPPELKAFFDYINDMDVPEDDGFIKALHSQVENYNTSYWRRKLMTLEEKMRIDQEQAYAKGKTEGIAEGIEEGGAKKNLENALKMKSEGLEADLIVKITGLTPEEIEKL